MVIIYKLYFKEKPMNIYIGITKGKLGKRKKNHLSDCKKKNTKKTKWLTKYISKGFDLIIEPLEICHLDIALNLEKDIINEYSLQGFKLYNSNKGGGGKLKQTSHTKKKISESNKGRKLTQEQYEKLLLYHKNRIKEISLETREKLSKALKGRKLSKSHIEKLKLNHVGNKGRKFTQEHKDKISKSLTGRKGKLLTLEQKELKRGKNNKQSKPITGVNQLTKEKVNYDSAGEAYRDLISKGIKISRASIYKCLSKQYESAGGYTWEHKEYY